MALHAATWPKGSQGGRMTHPCVEEVLSVLELLARPAASGQTPITDVALISTSRARSTILVPGTVANFAPATYLLNAARKGKEARRCPSLSQLRQGHLFSSNAAPAFLSTALRHTTSWPRGSMNTLRRISVLALVLLVLLSTSSQARMLRRSTMPARPLGCRDPGCLTCFTGEARKCTGSARALAASG